MLKNNLVWWLVLLTFISFSCKSIELVNIGNVSNITDAKLRSLLNENEIKYEKLYLKKVQFSFNDGKDERSFKGSFVVQKDSQIIVSIYALMGIELIRAQLTNNEVIIIDKHNKIVLKTNYNFFSKKYGIDLDFRTIQALITNSLFIYPSENEYYDDLKKYKHHIENEAYSFKSLKDKRLDRLSKRSRNDIIIHKISIHPDIYKIFNVYIKDFSNNQSLNVEYSEFSSKSGVLFPGKVKINGEKANSKLIVDMKINYLEVNDGGSLHFKIPSAYEIKDI